MGTKLMISSVAATIAVALMSAATLVHAAETPRVDARQERQQARIAQGAASGALTAREVRRLEREQRAVAHAEQHAKADGTVTAQERRRLDRVQDRASRDIYRQKHDRQARP